MRKVLDTDVVSRLQRDQLPDDYRQEVDGADLCITFVTVGELYKGAYKASWGPKRWAALQAWLKLPVTLEYDAAVARTWGWVSAEVERAGHPLPANDLWIAACCLAHDVPLVTLNRADFEPVPGLDLLPPT